MTPAVQRADASALIPAPIVTEIFKGMRERSIVMQAFREIGVPVTTTSMPVLDGLARAFFRKGDTGLSQADKLLWGSRSIVVDDLDVLIPIPDVVVMDSQFDIWGEVRDQAMEALANRLDLAVLRGEGAPTSFPTNVVSQIGTASQTRTRGTAAAAAGGIAEDLNQVMAFLENKGFNPTHFGADLALKSRLRTARDTTGQKLLDISAGEIEGLPIIFGMGGGWSLAAPATGDPELICFDRSNFVLGIQKQITWDILEHGVITDANGNIIWNLAQQKLKALRLSIRVGWQVANYMTRAAANSGTNEVKRIVISGVTTIGPGTFRVAFGGLWTRPMIVDITAANMQAELERLGTIGRDNVSVARSGSTPNFTYDITLKGSLGSQDITDEFTAENVTATTTGTPAFTITAPTAGVAPTKFPAASLLRP